MTLRLRERSARRAAARTARAALIAVVLAALPATGRADTGPVPDENARPGTPGWYMPTAPQPSEADQYAGIVASIDGWAWPLSVVPGQRVDLHVSAVPGVRYRVEVVRLGWYGGAGARRMACLPGCASDEAGVTQPLPPPPDPVTGEVAPAWAATDAITIPSSWPSGLYLAQLRITSGTGAGSVRRLPFVVRAPAGPGSEIVVVLPVNTWEAYNGWGGKSLYDTHSLDGHRASHVSFQRPWMEGIEQSTWRYDDYPLIRFLERHDLDVSYVTDADVSLTPGILAGHRIVMVSGHGEYWTTGERDALEAARDAGQSLAVMGANTGYWQVRYADAGTTLVGYKSFDDPIGDPARTTVRFRDVGRPECELLGVQYDESGWTLGESADLGVVDASLADPWLARSGFRPGDTVPETMGYEWDRVTPGCATPPLTRLFRWQADGWPVADAVRYTAPSGARVFAAGSLQFAWGLDGWRYGHAAAAPDARMEAFALAMLADMGRSAPDPAGPPPSEGPPTGSGGDGGGGPAALSGGAAGPPRRASAPLRLVISGSRTVRRGRRARVLLRVRNATGHRVRGVVLIGTLADGLGIDRASRAANRRVRSPRLRFMGRGRRVVFHVGAIGPRHAVAVWLSARVARSAPRGAGLHVVEVRRGGHVRVAVVGRRVTIR